MSEEWPKDSNNPAAPAELAKDNNDPKTALASRARNRTVMLPPEVTGQVRSMLGQDPTGKKLDPLAEIMNAHQSASESARKLDLSRPASEAAAPLSSDSAGFISLASREGAAKPRPQVAPSQHVVQAAKAPEIPQERHAPAPVRAISKGPKTKLTGFLISFDKEELGEVIELRVGRWLLSSRMTDHNETILIEDESVSPLHAIIRATQDGKIQILDQLSEFGTGVTRAKSEQEEEVTGSMTTVTHGDKVRFGKRHFIVCTIPGVSA
ncbi:FHA domain-containing protein [bacterium]|nr:FHA domain-containing protein [bacterium]